jgi:hypothetical protein
MEKKRKAIRLVGEEKAGGEGPELVEQPVMVEQHAPIAEAAQPMAPRPGRCRRYARRRVAERLPEIADKFLDEAQEGSCAHLKVMMQLGGLDVREPPKPAKRRGKGTAGRLLEEWRNGYADTGGDATDGTSGGE